jgi:hypothetical protein
VRAVCWLAGGPSASQKGICPMELVGWLVDSAAEFLLKSNSFLIRAVLLRGVLAELQLA